MKIIGLDIGTTSIGSAYIEIPDGGGDGTIRHLGVRIFPEGVTAKEREPRNKARRMARQMRRQNRRRKRRRKELADAFREAGLIPAFGTREWDAVMAEDPYNLRTRALTEKLAPGEIGRALYHLVKRRGFRFMRDLDAEADAADKETGVVKDAIRTLRADMGERTLGGHLSALDKKRGHHVGRDMVTAEFEAIWNAQKAHHPKLLTDDLWAKAFGIAFYQRPVYWRLDTLGSCRYEGRAPLCGKGSWLGQQYVLLTTLNSLRLVGGNERPLDANEREKALDVLMGSASVKFDRLRKALGLPGEARFNFEVGGKSALNGNLTEAHLAKIFGKAWETHPARDRVRAEFFDRLFDVFYRRVGDHRIEIRTPEEVEIRRQDFAGAIVGDWGVTEDEAAVLADLSLPSGWLRVSSRAVQKLLPHLESGLRYDEAVAAAYGASHSARDETGEILDKLPSKGKDMPDVRNPTVNRALNEVRKVVNNLLAVHGRPDFIRIELARDLRLPKKKRAEIEKRNREQETKRKDAAKGLAENGIPDANRRDIEKWLLWQECKETCPYTGDKISFDALFRRGEFDIEHIVPRGRSLDNSFGNKTLCRKEINIAKGNRTPFEYFRATDSAAWPEASGRIRNLALSPAKVRRFLREDWAGAEGEDWAARQLQDTAYIAVAVRDFLQRLGPAQDIKVQTCNGRVTAQLRHFWGLDGILGETGEKNRADHRHHAVDAVAIALATPAYVKRLSDHYRMEREAHPDQVPPPWPTIRTDAEKAVAGIVVSHRVWRKVSGPLHAQTAYGDTGQEVTEKGTTYRLFVTRKPLTGISASQVDDIRDEEIKRLVKAHIANRGGEIKKAFPPYPTLSDRKGGEREIKKVRIMVKQQMALMAPLHTRTRAYADTGENHHMAIFRMPDGKIRHEIVSRFEAARRLSVGEPVVRKQSADGGSFVMSLAPGDVLRFPAADAATTAYRIVQSVWASGQIVLIEHTVADGTVWKRPTSASVVAAGARKVAVDPIGRVRPAND